MGIRHVVDQQTGIGTPIESHTQTLKALLAGRVPDLQSHQMPLSGEIVIDNDIVLAQKVGTNGGLVLSREFSGGESVHERGLSDTGVAQDDNLERLFVAVTASWSVSRSWLAIGWCRRVAIGRRRTLVGIRVAVVGYRILVVRRRIGSLIVRRVGSLVVGIAVVCSVGGALIGIVAAIRVGSLVVCIVVVVGIGSVSILVVVCVGIGIVCIIVVGIVAIRIVVVVIVRHDSFLFLIGDGIVALRSSLFLLGGSLCFVNWICNSNSFSSSKV